MPSYSKSEIEWMKKNKDIEGLVRASRSDLLTEEVNALRKALEELLQEMKQEKDVQGISEALKLDSLYLKIAYLALEMLGEIGDARAVEPLVKALSDRGWEFGRAAAKALGKLGDMQAVEPLIRTLKDDMVGGAAAEALGELGDVRALDPLLRALKDKVPKIRRSAAKGLGKLGDVRALKPLIRALKDKNSTVRQSSAYSLGDLGDIQAVKPLIKTLGDKETFVVLAAAWALGNLGNPQAFEPLVHALSKVHFSSSDCEVYVGSIREIASGRIKSEISTRDRYLSSCYTFDFVELEESRSITDFPELNEIYRHSWKADTDFQGALSKIQTIWASFTNFDMAYVTKSNLYKSMGQLAEAKAVVQEGLDKSRRKYILLDIMGTLEFESGNLGNAVRFWIRSIIAQIFSNQVDRWNTFLYLAYIAEAANDLTTSQLLYSWSDKIHPGRIRFDDSLVRKVKQEVLAEKNVPIKSAIELLQKYLK